MSMVLSLYEFHFKLKGVGVENGIAFLEVEIEGVLHELKIPSVQRRFDTLLQEGKSDVDAAKQILNDFLATKATE